jgi:quinol monooxygenase YgiN
MIIVAGHLRVAPDNREEFLTRSYEAVRLAREAKGCHDFVVAADPLDDSRVNVYELWSDRDALDAFRGGGPGDQLGALILSAEIDEFDATPAARD